MPPWGRPPRGMDARSKREWETQAREYEARNRFEELDSEDEEHTRGGYDDSLYPDEYDELGEEYDEGDDWQLAMRQREEELAERALRRIRRARLRGETDVDLSREELDALEKRRYGQQVARPRPPKPLPPARRPAPAEASSSKGKRKTSGGLLSIASPSKPKSSKGSKATTSVAVADYSPATPPSEQQTAAGYFPRSANVSPRASRVSSRASLTSRPQQSQAQPPYPDLNAQHYRPSSSRSSARRADVSPTRSLPDDPDWVPGVRSRSSSSAQLYKPTSLSPPLPTGADAYPYQSAGPSYSSGRRIVSDPSAVAYSNVRRNPPPAAAGRSGLGREVIEISSDEDGEEEEDDESSDEGVRVDVVPEADAAGGYSMAVARAGAGGGRGGARPRRGGKR